MVARGGCRIVGCSTASMRFALLLAASALRLAGNLPVPSPSESPALVVFEGRVGPPEPGRSAAADLELAVAGTPLRFQVSRVRVLRGSFLGADLLAELSPQRPSLYLRGPDELLQKLGSATPDDRVELTGYHRTGSRDLLVSDVQVKSPNAGRSSASPR
jgi:hypothetical protein